jgi:hypothetical protein
MILQRLLDRLDRKLVWALISPQPETAADCDRYPGAHADLLRRVMQLRADMGLTPDQPEPPHSFSAAGVWHLIATDGAGEIAGTVRLHVIDRQREP